MYVYKISKSLCNKKAIKNNPNLILTSSKIYDCACVRGFPTSCSYHILVLGKIITAHFWRLDTVCPRSLVPFCIASISSNSDTTSWTTNTRRLLFYFVFWFGFYSNQTYNTFICRVYLRMMWYRTRFSISWAWVCWNTKQRCE